MQKIYDSSDFVARDALDAWRDVTWDAAMPTLFEAHTADPFKGRYRAMPLGAVRVSAMAYSSFRSYRTPRLIRAADPECLQISLVRSGPHRLEQNRSVTPVRPAEIVLLDSSRPFDSYADGESIALQFPRSLLPLPARHIDGVVARSLPARRGVGRLLADFLTRLVEDTAAYSPQDAARLGTVGLDLAAALVAHHADRERAVPVESRQHALYLRITAFIQCRLADPQLTAGDIAAAHHISVRTLHRLFQQQGVSVRGWIRDRRLERCRRHLADPAQRDVPIQAIAARCGFPRPADFTRTFRACHGMTPGEYRRRAGGDGGAASKGAFGESGGSGGGRDGAVGA